MADKKLLAVQKMYEKRIHQLEEIIEEQVCSIYGGLCLSLHDIGVPKEGIILCMESTKKYWNDSVQNGWDIMDAVREVCDINIINEVQKDESKREDDPEEDDLK